MDEGTSLAVVPGPPAACHVPQRLADIGRHRVVEEIDLVETGAPHGVFERIRRFTGEVQKRSGETSKTVSGCEILTFL